jgi:hypothetical protein
MNSRTVNYALSGVFLLGLVGVTGEVRAQTKLLRLFGRGTDNNLYTEQYNAGTGWSGWASLGGPIASAPTASYDSGGRPVVFVRGQDGAIWHIWLDSSTHQWSNFVSLGTAGGGQGRPGAALSQSGELTIFERSTDDLIHTKKYVPSGWTGWSLVGSNITSQTAPTAATLSDGRLVVFGLHQTFGDTGHMINTWHETGWRPWEIAATNNACNFTMSDLSATQDNSGTPVVFGISVNHKNQISHCFYRDNRWQTEEFNGPYFTAEYGPAGVLTPDGELAVYAVAANGNMLERVYRNGWGTDWNNRGGNFTSGAAALGK